MNNVDEAVLTLAMKLKRLADEGVEGEADNAKQMLERYMLKHGITCDMLQEDILEMRYFVFDCVEKKRLFIQIIASVIGAGKRPMYIDGKDKYNKLARCIDLSKTEFIEVDAKLDFYWRKFQEDIELFYLAFIQRNKLYIKSDEDKQDASEITPEEKARLWKVLQMMQGLDTHEFQKRIAAST